MKILQLQANLRAVIWSRIHRGELTGLALARNAGFQQAHLSNFLNFRRGLSVESMDRLLAAMGLSVLDLVETDELQRRFHNPQAGTSGQQAVAMVSAEHILSARFPPEQILETFSFKKSFLRNLRSHLLGDRSDWERFVIVKADASTARAMTPRVTSGTTMLIDRHYNSLEPYHRMRQNLYAVRSSEAMVIRYVSAVDDRLVLRPHQRDFPIELVTIERGRTFADYIIGRVCHLSLEV